MVKGGIWNRMMRAILGEESIGRFSISNNNGYDHKTTLGKRQNDQARNVGIALGTWPAEHFFCK